MSYQAMTMSGILDRMFDMDRHTQWLYEKRKQAASEAELEEIDREIREWWYDWKEYQT